jgi:hypothetical protein
MVLYLPAVHCAACVCWQKCPIIPWFSLGGVSGCPAPAVKLAQSQETIREAGPRASCCYDRVHILLRVITSLLRVIVQLVVDHDRRRYSYSPWRVIRRSPQYYRRWRPSSSSSHDTSYTLARLATAATDAAAVIRLIQISHVEDLGVTMNEGVLVPTLAVHPGRE